jgi:hypothetical protein
VHADRDQGVANLLELEWLDDCDDQFHDVVLWRWAVGDWRTPDALERIGPRKACCTRYRRRVGKISELFADRIGNTSKRGQVRTG